MALAADYNNSHDNIIHIQQLLLLLLLRLWWRSHRVTVIVLSCNCTISSKVNFKIEKTCAERERTAKAQNARQTNTNKVPKKGGSNPNVDLSVVKL